MHSFIKWVPFANLPNLLWSTPNWSCDDASFNKLYISVFISQSLTAFVDGFYSKTWQIPETTMRLCTFVFLACIGGLMVWTISSNFWFLISSIWSMIIDFHVACKKSCTNSALDFHRRKYKACVLGRCCAPCREHTMLMWTDKNLIVMCQNKINTDT